jgi:hypothetical protein
MRDVTVWQIEPSVDLPPHLSPSQRDACSHTTTVAASSVALGDDTAAEGNDLVAVGRDNVVEGDDSVIEQR